MPAQHRTRAGGTRVRSSHRRPAGWVPTAAVVLAALCGLVAVLLNGAVRGGGGEPAARARQLGNVRPAGTPTARPTATQPSMRARVDAAADYAAAHGVRAGIAVLDVKTGAYVGGGDDRGLFASASVMKVLVAARLLTHPGDSDASRDDLIEMIERSDDDAATEFWPAAGGPKLVGRIESEFGVDDLGTPNSKPNFWGNTHITARGLVRLYRVLAHDSTVGPIVLRAMRGYAHVAADGTDQVFGLAVAAGRPAVKQGWAAESADTPDDAIVNSTGLVDRGRYAVAILTEGDHNDADTDDECLNSVQRDVVTHLARLLMPTGWIDPAETS